MITKSQIKLIKSLSHKKHRLTHRLFVVEGQKNVAELLRSDNEIHSLFATSNWIKKNSVCKVVQVSQSELKRISNYKTANEVLALVKIKIPVFESFTGVTLILDGVNDPGNMGAIIRACDWFGVRSIVCSNNTVDIYNPKVVQSAMGSIFRVNVMYTNLTEYIKTINMPIFGAFMQGENVKNVSLPKDLCLVMGNESSGITQEVSSLINKRLAISRLGKDIDSLNVAVATSIFLHEICS